jgi:hypothetical protein
VVSKPAAAGAQASPAAAGGQARIALGGLLAMVAVGAWLIAAPFAVRYQPAGARWTGPARMDMAVGAIVATVGFAGFFLALAGQVRELYTARGPERPPG